MKKIIGFTVALAIILSLFTGCAANQPGETGEVQVTGIQLSDDGVMVGGSPASSDKNADVYVSNDMAKVKVMSHIHRLKLTGIQL